MLIMMIELKGKSLKGKNRIRELGRDWIILGKHDLVFFDSRTGPGMWLKVAPMKINTVSSVFLEKWRWIHATDDKDFDIIDKNI